MPEKKEKEEKLTNDDLSDGLLSGMANALDFVGFSDEYIAKNLKRLSKAKTSKFFQKDGVVVTHKRVAALSIQLEALREAARLKGLYKDDGGPSGNYIVQIIEGDMVELDADKQDEDSNTAQLDPSEVSETPVELHEERG